MTKIYFYWPYVKYTNIFHSKALQNLPKLVFLVGKYTSWQRCSSVDTFHWQSPLSGFSLVYAMGDFYLPRRLYCALQPFILCKKMRAIYSNHAGPFLKKVPFRFKSGLPDGIFSYQIT
jgi:hypothetical protein